MVGLPWKLALKKGKMSKIDQMMQNRCDFLHQNCVRPELFFNDLNPPAKGNFRSLVREAD
jgi:hypothetical protein